jgi:hypothetical protein
LGISIVPSCIVGSVEPSSGGGGNGVGSGAATVVGGEVVVVVVVVDDVVVDVVVLVELVVVTSRVAGVVEVGGAAPRPLVHAPRTSAPAIARRAQRRMAASLPALADHDPAASRATTAAAVRRAWSTHAGTPMPS